jgi:SseB protein N-terminal domain/SseB protein C-terminal domain
MRLPDKRIGTSITCIKRADDGDPSPPSPGTAQATPSTSPQFDHSPLPAAMLAVAHDDSPENWRVLYESMFKTWFLVPTREDPPDTPGFHDIQENIAPSFSLEHDSKGQLVAVAFTDEEALRNWNKSISWIALQGTAFFQAVLSTQAEEIVINPFEPEDPASKMIRPGGRVTRWEFESLAQGVVPQPQPDGDADAQSAGSQSVLVSMPKHMPSAATFSALAGAAGAFPQVVAMYFAQVGYPDGKSHWTVAVEFAPGVSRQQIEAAMAALVQEARRVFPKKELADFLLASSHLGQSIATTGEKFYSAAK